MNKLNDNTVRLITSGQVITSVSNVVKELIENSLDAGATNIDIKLTNFGLDLIEVKDNGSGVSSDNMEAMVASHCTSKIREFSDLSKVSSYGFRGEALNSLCSVSTLEISSKREEDKIGKCVKFSKVGQKISESNVAITKGTVIKAFDIFQNLPVRKNFYKKKERQKEDLKKIENFIWSYGIIHPNLRISLLHNKHQIALKTSCNSLMKCAQQCFGVEVFSKLELLQLNYEEESVEADLIIAKNEPGNIENCSRSTNERTFVYVNQRPVVSKSLEKVLRKNFNEKYPLGILSLKLPNENVDVNLDPNKISVMISKQNSIMDFLDHEFKKIYENTESDNDIMPKVLPSGDSTKTITENVTVGKPSQNLTEDSIPVNKIQNKWKRFMDNDPELKLDSVQTNPFPTDSMTTIDDTMDKFEPPTFQSSRNYHKDEQRLESVSDQIVSNPNQISNQKFFEKESLIQTDRAYSEKEAPTVRQNSMTSNDSSISLIESSILNETDNSTIEKENIENALQKGPAKNSQGSWGKGTLFKTFQPVSILTGKLARTENVPKRKDKELGPNPEFLEAKEKQSLITSFSEDMDQSGLISSTKKRKIENSSEKRQTKMKRISSNEDPPQVNESVKITDFKRFRREMKVDFRVEKVHNTIVPKTNKNLIGHWQESGFWLVKFADEIKIFNHLRVQEIKLFKRLMMNHCLKSKPLPKGPIDIFQETRWDTNLNDTLKNLFVDNEIIDKRLTLNGLKIQKSPSGNPMLTEVCPKIPFMGISDLIEIVKSIQKNSNARIEECRPLKVLSFLKGEARRITKQMPPNEDENTVTELFNFVKEEKLDLCIHSKPIFYTLFKAE